MNDVALDKLKIELPLSAIAEKETGVKINDSAALSAKLMGWGAVFYGALQTALGVAAMFKGGRAGLAEIGQGSENVAHALTRPKWTALAGVAWASVGAQVIGVANYAKRMHNLKEVDLTIHKKELVATPAPVTHVAKLAARDDVAAEKSPGQSVG